MQQAEQLRAAIEIRSRRGTSRQQQIEAILANLPEPVLAIDTFDELVLANASAAKLFDLDLETAIGKPLAHVVHCERLVNLLIDTRRRKAPTQRPERSR